MDQNLAQGANQSLEQTHILSPQHLQALKALQAPLMELSGSFADVLAENPLITTEDDVDFEDDPELQPDTAEQDAAELDDVPFENLDENRLDYDEELERILEDDDAWASIRPENGGDASGGEAEKRREYMFNSVAQETSLQEKLLEQLGAEDCAPEVRRAAEEIIGNIDDDGFFRSVTAEIAQAVPCPLETAEAALRLVQTFDPPGIAASSLQECLLIQLERAGKKTGRMTEFVTRHLDDLEHNRLPKIAKDMGVTVQDVKIINSPFWSNHLYRCENVRYLGCFIFAPTENVTPVDPKRGGPSTDAIDLDICQNVLIHGCFMHVNDDAVVIKGGKGTWADKNPDNGPCRNIIIEDCIYGKVHGCLTLGSESLDDHNIILRRIDVKNATRVLWLKMRPDTPQHYEYVTVEDIKGKCGSFLVVRPWTQFFKPEDREDMPLSQCNNIVMKNIEMDCNNFFDVGLSDKYRLVDFTFENINVTDKKNAFDKTMIEGTTVRNVVINGTAR